MYCGASYAMHFYSKCLSGFSMPMNPDSPAKIPTQMQYFSTPSSILHYPHESDALGLFGCQLIFKRCNILVHMAVIVWCGFCSLRQSQYGIQDPSWHTEKILPVGKWLFLWNNANVLHKNDSHRSKHLFQFSSVWLYE